MDKQTSTVMKGVAILMMLFYHLYYGWPDVNPLCTPLLFIGSEPLVHLLANACYPVSFFMILSGYGLTCKYHAGSLSVQQQLPRVLRLYAYYWLVMLVFVTLGHFIHPETYPNDLPHLVGNLLAVRCNYNGEVWFLFPYAIVSLTSPWLVSAYYRLSTAGQKVVGAAAVCLLFAGAKVLSEHLSDNLALNIAETQLVYYVILTIYFLLGVILYDLLQSSLNRAVRSTAACWLLLAVIVGVKSLFKVTILDGLYALAFIFLFAHVPVRSIVRTALLSLGRHSMIMWMTHTYFCWYFFPDLIFGFRYPLLIFIALVIVSYLTSVIMMKIAQPLLNRLQFLTVLLPLTLASPSARAQTSVTLPQLSEIGLPIVLVETVGQEEPSCEYLTVWDGYPGNTIRNATKVPGRVRVMERGTTIFDSGEYAEGQSGMTIKIRGNSSAVAPAKKPFKIKLQKKADMLCRGNDDTYNDKDWLLLKDEVTSLNQMIALKVSQLMEMPYTPGYKYVNLMVNGDYRGIYILQESVKRNKDCRINVSKQSGYIIEWDPYWWNEDKSFESSMTYNYTFKYPDADDVTDEQLHYIADYMKKAEQSLSHDNYTDYVDPASLANWLLAHDLLGTLDGGGSNIFFSKHDSTPASRLQMPCLWDFDTVLQRDNNWAAIHVWDGFIFPRLFSNANPAFTHAYRRRWDEIAPTFFTRIQQFISEFETSSLAAALEASRPLDYARWQTEGTTVAEDVGRLRQWFADRQTLLKGAIEYLYKTDPQLDANPQMTIDGRPVLYDSQTNTLLANIPQTAFGTDYTADIAAGSGYKDLKVNGTATHGSYTFSQVGGGKQYLVTLTDNADRQLTANLTFTFLPMLQLKGSFGYNYQDGTVTLVDAGSETDSDMTASIRWRGSTTNIDEKHKKNYKIKFPSDRRFFSLRKDNVWLLDAGQKDMFRLRNLIATELWNDMAAKPYYYDQQPEARSGVRGRVVEVFLNSEYRGIYAFLEAMDRKQLKLKKYDEQTGEIHGGLWKAEDWTNPGMYSLGSLYDNQSPQWESFTVKYPKLDDVQTTDYSTLYNAVDFLVGSSDEEFSRHVGQYFDLPVVTDYHIFLQTMAAIDNRGKNMYWAVYDKTEDKKITPAVWDLDCSAGAVWTENWIKGSSEPDYDMMTAMNIYERLEKTNTDNFIEKRNKRYHDLRQSVLSEESLVERYRKHYDMIALSGAKGREEDKWSGDSDIQNRTLDFKSEIAFISSWLRNRVEYLDQNMYQDTSAGIRTVGPADHDSSPAAVYSLSGQRISKFPAAKGIYVSKGKKFVVR